MAKVNVDIVQLKALVTDFDKCVSSYKVSVDSFFGEIKKYKGWEGEAADQYLNAVNAESVKYVEFGESLQGFVSLLNDIINNLEATVNSSARN
jgi:uncharacterized protein YukE